MALWDRQKLPDDLKDKSTEEITKIINDGRDAATARDAALQAKTDADNQLVEMRKQLDAANARLNAAPPPPEPAHDEPLPEPTSPWLDPSKFVQEETKGVRDVALNAGLLTAKMYCLNNLSDRDRKIFKKFEKEVDGIVGTFAPEARVMPQAWFNALLFVKGAHEQDISKAERESTDFFAETPSRQGPPPPVPEDKLTAEEEEVCRKFHFDPAGYLKQRKAMQMAQSERGSYARFEVKSNAR